VNPRKQEAKIIKCQKKADECATRQEAQKILRKWEKANAKLEVYRHIDHGSSDCYLGFGHVQSWTN
jgi:hypothetical protein